MENFILRFDRVVDPKQRNRKWKRTTVLKRRMKRMMKMRRRKMTRRKRRRMTTSKLATSDRLNRTDRLLAGLSLSRMLCR